MVYGLCKALLLFGIVVVNDPFIKRPYCLQGGGGAGVPLDSHDIAQNHMEPPCCFCKIPLNKKALLH